MDCLCGHKKEYHLDHRTEWSVCHAGNCGCLAFTPSQTQEE